MLATTVIRRSKQDNWRQKKLVNVSDVSQITDNSEAAKRDWQCRSHMKTTTSQCALDYPQKQYCGTFQKTGCARH
jgi:hypothetical protein